jgi:hypothetical protein
MWAAIALSALALAFWGVSLSFFVGVGVGHFACATGDGLFIMQRDLLLPSPLEVWARPASDVRSPAERHYGFELPSAATYGDARSYRQDVLYLPLWVPLLISTSAAVLLWRSSRRIPDDHCRKCGYDLTGNVSGRCPECGEVIPENPEE